MYEQLHNIMKTRKIRKNGEENPWYYNCFNKERQGTQIWMVRYKDLRVR